MTGALFEVEAGVGVGVRVGVGVGVRVGVRVGLTVLVTTFTPLFQTYFLPLLIQVYLIPADELIWPSFLQAVPGYTAAVAVERFSVKTKHPITVVAIIRFILPRITMRDLRE